MNAPCLTLLVALGVLVASLLALALLDSAESAR